MYLRLFCLFLCVWVTKAQYEGEFCAKDGVAGVCKILNQCPSAIDDIKHRRNPQICSFSNADPIVCCLDGRATAVPVVPIPLTTTRRPAVTAPTETEPDYYDSECEPIPASLTTSKTGQKAFDKCIEYQEKYVYPCEKSTALTGGLSRSKKCHHTADDLIIGGEDAAQYEFPHMVMVGYGDSIDDIQYRCGGSIISEKFILTAGHCSFHRDLGPLTYVAVGALTRDEAADKSKVYKVKKIIKHPEYKSTSTYNDIALIETEKTIPLDQFTVPACLDVGDTTNVAKVLATGWGIKDDGYASNSLQKVTLYKFTTEECSNEWPASRVMLHGFDAQSQMCYGHRNESKDTCRGDSGGPIQVKNRKINCMYTIVGVTSSGRHCGFVNTAAKYTRVSHYVSWIESIVWPN